MPKKRWAELTQHGGGDSDAFWDLADQVARLPAQSIEDAAAKAALIARLLPESGSDILPLAARTLAEYLEKTTGLRETA